MNNDDIAIVSSYVHSRAFKWVRGPRISVEIRRTFERIEFEPIDEIDGK